MYKLVVYNSSKEIEYQVSNFPSVENAQNYAEAYNVDATPGWYYEIVPV